MRYPFLPFVLLLVLGSIQLPAIGQARNEKAWSQQLSFTGDNNYFLFTGDDGYYTSGLFARYDRLRRKQPSTSTKRLFSYEIGQMIYTAHSRKILPQSNQRFPSGMDEVDRPIAGYLFGKASSTTFYANNRMVTVGVSIGSIGDNSLARSVQETWHRKVGIKNYWNWVWDYQVKNEVGVNVHGTFAQNLLNIEQHPFFQVTPVTQATLGTTFTNVSQAVLLQVGRLRSLQASSYWNSRLELIRTTKDSGFELFFYYKPELRYQLYNATIQGGLFREDKGPIVSEIKPIVFSHEVGLRFSASRYCVGYRAVFQSREARSQFYRQSFASVFVAFRFG